MKQVHGPSVSVRNNAWGRPQKLTITAYEVESKDVGTTKANYLGYNNGHYKFKESDVGRHINVFTDGTGWTNWGFGFIVPAPKEGNSHG